MRFNQQDDQDRAVLRRLETLSEAQLSAYHRLHPKNLRHYLTEQQPWLEDEIYFLGVQLQRPPTEAEVAEAILHQCHSQRFRAFYALRFPAEVQLAAS